MDIFNRKKVEKLTKEIEKLKKEKEDMESGKHTTGLHCEGCVHEIKQQCASIYSGFYDKRICLLDNYCKDRDTKKKVLL